MGTDNYYFIEAVSHAASTITGRLGFRPEHAVFKGHFPDRPVVPGVCMLEIVKTVLQDQLWQRLMLVRASRIKFLQALIPLADERIQLTVGYEEQEGEIAVTAQFSREGLAVFKFQGRFVATHNGPTPQLSGPSV